MKSAEPDKQILKLAQGGDAAALAVVVDSCSRAVFNLCYRMTASREESEDLAQEIFFHLCRNLDRYDISRPFVPWLYKVAANYVLNHLKKKRIQSVSIEQLAPRGERKYELEDVRPGTAGTPDKKESAGVLREAIEALPESYRTVVVLRYLEDMKISEIAKVLEIPVGTAKVRLFRARDILRSQLRNFLET